MMTSTIFKILYVLTIFTYLDTTPITQQQQQQGQFQIVKLDLSNHVGINTSPSSLSTLAHKATMNVEKYASSAFNSVSKLSSSSSKSSIGCVACRMIAKAAHFVVKSGATEDEIARWGTEICIKLKQGSPRECRGLCESMKKEVVYVFSQKSIDPGGTCSSILDEDCGVSPGDQWSLNLPDIPKPNVSKVLPPQPGGEILRILHLTDIHLDPMYVAGSKVDCGETLCCRDIDGNGTSLDSTAGKFGGYRGCDTPLATLESLLKHASINHRIDFVLWTGDDSPHDNWNLTEESHLMILDEIDKLFHKYFPLTPVFPAVGNHEGNPVNSFPPPFVKSVASMDWLYTSLNRTWNKWLPKNAHRKTSTTILKGGFYSTPIFPGLRIISLNMNYCNNLNWWLLLNTTDPLGQLNWLIDELQDAENFGEKVYIIGHIPPGSYDCLTVWSGNYYRIVNRYESIIRGQFFGHTHNDHFQVFYDLNLTPVRPTNVAYIAPSVTTYNAGNPAYRIYTVDGDHPQTTWAVLDHETYFVNLTEANLNGKPKWYLLYRAKDDYQMESLQPSDWNKLINRLSMDDSLFRKFYRNFHRASDAYPKCDTDKCRKSLICGMRSARSGDLNLCQRAAGGFFN